uniref:carboxypeptidase-like regulatory domain-containing protein n=1 Tax=Gaetbulibacter jejuensis TaxID=584607 RepID=UPI00300A753E
MKKYIFIVGLLFPYALFAQSILGKVTNEKNEPLVGASVFWANTTIGTTTGIKGEFELTTKDISPKLLIASYVGHIADTIEITNQTFVEFKLEQSQELDEVVVKGQRDGVIISNLNK